MDTVGARMSGFFGVVNKLQALQVSHQATCTHVSSSLVPAVRSCPKVTRASQRTVLTRCPSLLLWSVEAGLQRAQPYFACESAAGHPMDAADGVQLCGPASIHRARRTAYKDEECVDLTTSHDSSIATYIPTTDLFRLPTLQNAFHSHSAIPG